MKILLIAGHGASDPGAIGVNGIREADKNREVVNVLKNKFSPRDEVDVYPMGRSAFNDLQKTGQFAIDVKKYDYVLEVHFNAFNGQAFGTECYVTYAEQGITVEQDMMKALSKYFKLRDSDGVKRTDFLVIKELKKLGISACLVEMCFIDNASDMAIYENNRINICSDMAKAIDKAFGVVPTPTPTPTPTPPKPDQILNVGSKVIFYEHMVVDKINYVPNVVDMAHIPYIGGWVNSSILVEDGGNNAVDQLLKVGSTVTIKGTFTVTKVDTTNDLVFLQELGFWVKARALEEI